MALSVPNFAAINVELLIGERTMTQKHRHEMAARAQIEKAKTEINTSTCPKIIAHYQKWLHTMTEILDET